MAEARRELEVKVNMDLNYSPAWAGAPEGPGTHPWRFRLFAGGERGIRPRGDRLFLKPQSTRALALSLTQGNRLPASLVLIPQVSPP